MEIQSIESFLDYYEKTRTVTNRVIEVVPPDRVDWSYMPGKFTIGDLIRHIAAIERNVFAEVVMGNRPSYKGCRKDLADGLDNIVAYFNEMHKQTIEILQTLTVESLKTKIRSLDGREIERGRFLRALVVHEIHHRGALCIYLNQIGVVPPPVIGMTEKQVIELSS